MCNKRYGIEVIWWRFSDEVDVDLLIALVASCRGERSNLEERANTIDGLVCFFDNPMPFLCKIFQSPYAEMPLQLSAIFDREFTIQFAETDECLINWDWVNCIDTVEGCIVAMAQCQTNWNTAVATDRFSLLDKIEANQLAVFEKYKRLGGKAVQIGDLMSCKGEIRMDAQPGG